MANLQEFNPGDLGLRPSETGVEAFQPTRIAMRKLRAISKDLK
jgi:hypothetical protein